ncbi:MAG: hypothetical protein K0R15_2570 [Clostridiales bacterium]|jgi:uncharacterized 2Fe-2S/4Fe-4S cluster protein (DUF4445 family)|nr:hypothetical protein [Clostridiales bacterium]
MKAMNLRLNLNDLELKKILERYNFNVQNDYEIAVKVKNRIMSSMCAELYYEEYNKEKGNIENLHQDRDYYVGALTLGEEIDEISEQLKKQELFLAVHILECLCNELLRKAYQQFSSFMSLHSGNGIQQILFPGEDMPIEKVKDILKILDIGQISVNKYLILTPSKSVVFIAEMAKDDKLCVLHNCASCKNYKCSMRTGNKKELVIAAENIEGDKLGVAIDIGTTTVEVQIVNSRNGEVLGKIKEYNSQRVYGLDVITRAESVISDKEIAKKCQRVIRNQLAKMIKELVGKLNTSIELIETACITGNTIMIHLLMNYEVKGLVKYPFIPVTIERLVLAGSEIGLKCRVNILPGVSAYVGADILAGITACGFGTSRELQLFVDLGTNAEIVLGNRDKYLATSTALGPTFEGANISCGMSALDGAISGFDGRNYTVLGKQKPKGICASGLIDVLEYLLRERLVDDTGLMADHLNGEFKLIAGITITQADIRELQLAISAVRTGIEILMENYCVSTVSNVILTGGFAKYANAENMVKIGLLPVDCIHKISLVENASLLGAKRACIDNKFIEECEILRKKMHCIELSNASEFNMKFIANISF